MENKAHALIAGVFVVVVTALLALSEIFGTDLPQDDPYGLGVG